ncbi:MAG: proton-conducting membrane transporter [Eubacterium sp.]|nr:proton-conducting membrane transporter [Eubacterium sp.]
MKMVGMTPLRLLSLGEGLDIVFAPDRLSILFVCITTLIWLLAGIYAIIYMKKEGRPKRFFFFYIMLYVVLVALDCAANLITFYLCYELMTLVSMMLVVHHGTREAVMATLKYLFYSLCGAYLGLFGIFYLNRYCTDLNFDGVGKLNTAMLQGKEQTLLLIVFLMIIGFGAKAGMFPLHGWLPAAHPIAPSPASAILSAIIVKAGVLATIRVIYQIVGVEFVRGTWVQTAWMMLTLLTVFMGSLLAYREPVIKKRFAYSTVSQVSYILFGLSLLQEQALTGSLLHVCFHAVIKCGLFLCAGIFLVLCEKRRVDELDGIGRKMPVLLGCYTCFALALIGIPPTSGFVSKWQLALGAMDANVGVFGWLGPVVLLLSALLTAGYLLPITMRGYFPGESDRCEALAKKEPPFGMLLPIALLALLAVCFGIFPNQMIELCEELASALMKGGIV